MNYSQKPCKALKLVCQLAINYVEVCLIIRIILDNIVRAALVAILITDFNLLNFE